MNYFEFTLFYQSLILLASYRFGFSEVLEYDLKLDLVSMGGSIEESRWKSVLLSKLESDRFIFRNDELYEICGGAFSSSDIEIIEVFGRVITFSLVRGKSHLLINLLFTGNSSVQLFFGDVRSQQKNECSKEVFTVDKLFQYQFYFPQKTEERLQLLAESAVVYLKNSSGNLYARPKTINFAKYRNIAASQGAYLVLQSMTFNLKRRRGSIVFVLCSLNILTHRFFLRFPDARSAKNFYLAVEGDLSDQIPCSNDMLTPEILEQIKSF